MSLAAALMTTQRPIDRHRRPKCDQAKTANKYGWKKSHTHKVTHTHTCQVEKEASKKNATCNLQLDLQFCGLLQHFSAKCWSIVRGRHINPVWGNSGTHTATLPLISSSILCPYTLLLPSSAWHSPSTFSFCLQPALTGSAQQSIFFLEPDCLLELRWLGWLCWGSATPTPAINAPHRLHFDHNANNHHLAGLARKIHKPLAQLRDYTVRKKARELRKNYR